MKLSTKILTALLPAAALGTIVPATVSCSCGGNSYVINYGDDVNCLDEKAENYHSLDDVKSAVKSRALKEPAGKVSSSTLTDLSNNIFKPQNIQMFYYDLIASYTIIADTKISLSNWKANTDNKTLSFAFGNENWNITSISYQYVEPDDGIEIYVQIPGKAMKLGISYRFSDCTYSG